MAKKEPITMHRKLLGYMDADRTKPIFAAMPGALVTHAFILCHNCNDPISSNMGPRRNAWCIDCTAKNEELVIQQEKEKKEEERRARLKKKKEEEKRKEEEAKRNIDG